MLAQAAVKGYNAMSVEIMWKQTRRVSKVSRRALETLEKRVSLHEVSLPRRCQRRAWAALHLLGAVSAQLCLLQSGVWSVWRLVAVFVRECQFDRLWTSVSLQCGAAAPVWRLDAVSTSQNACDHVALFYSIRCLTSVKARERL